MTKIILVRHGHVEGIEPERFRGRLQLELTELGRRQARATAQRIAAVWRPAALYTSPMHRCVDTATAIGALAGVEAKPDNRLNDIDYGEWQGLTPDAARSNWPEAVAAWYRVPHLTEIPKGESLPAMSARATEALRDLVCRHPRDVVVVVGHDSLNRALLLQVLDLPLSRYWRLRQDPCAVNEFDCDDGLFTIRRINETWHLKDV